MEITQDYLWVTGTATMPDKSTYNFIVTNVQLWEESLLELKLTSWEHKGKYSLIADYEIDDTLQFDN